VESWTRARSGQVSGCVSWTGSPHLTFELTINPDGGLVQLLTRAQPGNVVRARQLREAPVGAMERALRAAATEQSPRSGPPYRTPRLEIVDRQRSGGEDPDQERMRWRAWTADFILRPRTGTGGRSDRPYAALAACYVAAFERGEISPVKAVARELAFEDRAVRNYLTKARERGLLTPADPGCPGGRLTEKSRRILRGHGFDPPQAGPIP
jgi:hypothetical protein